MESLTELGSAVGALLKERKQWPRNLVGAQSRPGSMQIDRNLRDAILNAELFAMPVRAKPLSGDGCQLEFYDGYPKLPECLQRRDNHEVISTIFLNEGCAT